MRNPHSILGEARLHLGPIVAAAAATFGVLCGPALAAGPPAIQAVGVDRAPVDDPAAPLWDKAQPLEVAVMPQSIAYPMNPQASVASLQVRALVDPHWVALRLEWEDGTQDQKVEVDEFTDGVAVELPLGDAEKTSPMMGAEGAPVYIAHWKAVWQHDVENGHADVQDYHPGYWADPYPFVSGRYPYDVSESFQGSDARRYFVGTSAGNPVSKLDRRWPVEELHAEGFGSLADHNEQDARAWGRWKDGRWTVVIALPRQVADPANPPLLSGSTKKIAFAVWDGNKRNVGGRKHWYPFVDLVLPDGPVTGR
jgi:hypothetical protein